MGCSWEKVSLGSTALRSSPIGIGSSYGVEARDVQRAFERGVNYFYWGSMRRECFATALRNLGGKHRESMILVVQSYTRVASLLALSVDLALRRLRTDYADILLLGWWNHRPPARILDAAGALRDQGRVRHLMISGHQRQAFPSFLSDTTFDAIMVRYNASHCGAESEVFPRLPTRPVGVVAYTATRWGTLCDPRNTPPGEPTPRGSDCYRFVLSNPAVNIVLAGPKNGAELDEALRALDRGPMSSDEMAWMRRVGAAVRRNAWTADFGRV